MSNLIIPFDPAGLDPKVVNAFDDLIASVQTWAGRQTANQSITGSFTAIQPRCRLYFSGALTVQSIPSATLTEVIWPTVGSTLDTPDAQYDNGAAFGGRFLETSGAWLLPPVAGQYLVIANPSITQNGTGSRNFVLHQRVDGVSTLMYSSTVVGTAGVTANIQVCGVFSVRGRDSGDAIAFKVFQDSGIALDIKSGTFISVIKLS